MEKRKLSLDMMQFLGLFDSITHVNAKDCFIDEVTGILTFVVPEGQLGKALGKGASNVHLLEKKLNRRVKLVEYSDDVKSFIKSLLLPLKVDGVDEIDDKVYMIQPADIKSRGLIIGRSAVNLRNLEKIVRRYFDVHEIKVV